MSSALRLFKPTWLIGSYNYSSLDVSPHSDFFALACNQTLLIGLYRDLFSDAVPIKETATSSAFSTSAARLVLPQNGLTHVHLHHPINRVRFSPNGKYIACALESGIRVLRRVSNDFSKPETFPLPSACSFNGFPDISWSKCSSFLSGVDFNGSVVIWNVESKIITSSINCFDRPAKSIAFHPSGTLLSVQSDESGEAKLLSFSDSSLSILTTISVPFIVEDRQVPNVVESLIHGFSPDGKYLIHGNVYNGAHAVSLIQSKNDCLSSSPSDYDPSNQNLWYGFTYPVVCISWSPFLYSFSDSSSPVPIYACATRFTELIICRADSAVPLLVLEKLTWINDLVWLPSGLGVVFCSGVGHVGVVVFEDLDYWPIRIGHNHESMSVESLPSIVNPPQSTSNQKIVQSNQPLQIKSKKNSTIRIERMDSTQSKTTLETESRPNQSTLVPEKAQTTSINQPPIQSSIPPLSTLSSEINGILIEWKSVSSTHSLMTCSQSITQSINWSWLFSSLPAFLKFTGKFLIICDSLGLLQFFNVNGTPYLLAPIQTTGINFACISFINIFVITTDCKLLIFNTLEDNSIIFDCSVDVTALLAPRQGSKIVAVSRDDFGLSVSLCTFENFVYNFDSKIWVLTKSNVHVYSHLIGLEKSDNIDPILLSAANLFNTKLTGITPQQAEILDSIDLTFSEFRTGLFLKDSSKIFYWLPRVAQSLVTCGDVNRLSILIEQIILPSHLSTVLSCIGIDSRTLFNCIFEFIKENNATLKQQIISMFEGFDAFLS
ncbi:hypothetical protein RCL1_008463 [Eukaryota sp. TZLM3-RCL]